MISSAITMCAKIAPRLNSNSRSTGLYTDTPVTSPGSRSGVNWMRRTVASTLAARARASIVLPTPGTSSMSRCPSASRQMRALRTASGFPSITPPTEARIAEVRAANSSAEIMGAFSGMRSLSRRRGGARDTIVTRPGGAKAGRFPSVEDPRDAPRTGRVRKPARIIG